MKRADFHLGTTPHPSSVVAIAWFSAPCPHPTSCSSDFCFLIASGGRAQWGGERIQRVAPSHSEVGQPWSTLQNQDDSCTTQWLLLKTTSLVSFAFSYTLIISFIYITHFPCIFYVFLRQNLAFKIQHVTLLTNIAMSSFHMEFHIAFLCKAHCTVITLVRPLSCMLFHMHLKRTLLVKGFFTKCTLKWTLPWTWEKCALLS